jgi:hypothetical protein
MVHVSVFRVPLTNFKPFTTPGTRAAGLFAWSVLCRNALSNKDVEVECSRVLKEF